MDELAHKLTERPVSGRVDDGVERHAEDKEQHVGDSQVQDEQTCRVASVVAVLQHDDKDKTVADAPKHDDDPEQRWHDVALRAGHATRRLPKPVGLVRLGEVRLDISEYGLRDCPIRNRIRIHVPGINQSAVVADAVRLLINKCRLLISIRRSPLSPIGRRREKAACQSIRRRWIRGWPSDRLIN